MPHSNFKDKAYEFNLGIGKCPCGQTFECSKSFDKIGVPKKAMTLREQQLGEAERIRKVHN